VQSLPQKRRTLSSGLSQYQHDPLGGKACRLSDGAALSAGAVLVIVSLSCALSDPGSTLCTPFLATGVALVGKQDYVSETSQA
jgi:hypothetical protein